MDECEQLRSIVKRRTQRKLGSTTRLGDVLSKLMENQISPRRERFEPVAQLWSQLLPAELHRHCKIVDISAGQMKVLVDSPSYMYELKLCSPELLEELQRNTSTRIKKIKFAVGQIASCE
jgi:hypothetical protein